MPTLPLTPDQLLSTTRSVRKRLDLTRPVERTLLEECLTLAQQAPTAVNRQDWHFVVVSDARRRAGLAELYRRGAEAYVARRAAEPVTADPARLAQLARLWTSASHLLEHIGEVPVLVVPCIEGRTDGLPGPGQASRWASIIPAAWSFMLAARARGLGSCWTTFHLAHEREAAELLGIPYDQVMQAALIPVAHTVGTDFRPAPREPLETMVHWDAW